MRTTNGWVLATTLAFGLVAIGHADAAGMETQKTTVHVAKPVKTGRAKAPPAGANPTTALQVNKDYFSSEQFSEETVDTTEEVTEETTTTTEEHSSEEHSSESSSEEHSSESATEEHEEHEEHSDAPAEPAEPADEPAEASDDSEH